MLTSFFGYVRRTWNTRDIVFTIVISLICLVLWELPTGFEDRLPKNTTHAMGEVIEVDNDEVFTAGLVRQGSQTLTVQVKDGPFAGELVEAQNLFIGKLELDAFFEKGDRALLNLSVKDGRIVSARAVDHYRLDIEAWLFVGFGVLLVAVCGWTGARTLLSFIFTGIVIWKVLIPCYLLDYDPILIAAAVTAVLSTVIVLLVGGVRKRGLVAVFGSLLGLGCALVVSLVISGPFNLNGTVRPFSETLLYSGFEYLDLRGIFIASIFIAASGAMMDLAMDLAASMGELVRHRPDLSRWKLFLSGITIARAITGTMATTLLLAYSGGYITMLMYFMGSGVPLANCLNLTYVSAEILYTLVGSFSLVATGPLTALVGTLVFGGGHAETATAGAVEIPFGET
jgi:uncharacterized membrane protein